MRAVWILMFLAVMAYSSQDSDIMEAEIRKGSTDPRPSGRTQTGRVDCCSLGGELSRLSAQGNRTRELLAHKYPTIFLV